MQQCKIQHLLGSVHSQVLQLRYNWQLFSRIRSIKEKKNTPNTSFSMYLNTEGLSHAKHRSY